MSQTPRGHKLDEFLDRVMDAGEAADFGREVESDADLHQEAELQQWIDSELGDMFAYDSSRAPKIPHAEVEAAPIPIMARRQVWKPLALAAAVVLAGVAVWIGVYRGGGGGPQVRYVAAATVYEKLNAGGFEPEFVCTTDEEFKAATTKRFGTPLVLASAPGVTPLGWAYNAGFRGRIVGERTMMLLMKVDDANVLVLMDTTDRPADHPVNVPEGSGLRVFKRQVGPIVNYEITPLDSARVIEHLREP